MTGRYIRQVEYSIKQLFSVFGWTDSRTQNYRLKNDDMKKNCVNCHFLAKKTLLKDNNSISDSISSEERVKLKSQKVKPTFDLYTTTLCHKGVWDEGILPHQDYYSSTVSKSRNSCFFFSHKESMLFKAADELQKREDERVKFHRSNKYSVIALWIAGLALVANAVIGIIRLTSSS
jgi:hypothetical protein